ncbi:MAG: YciI family protein [Neisseria sp.]|nr:YciI family protein [Neisseria sp.]
MTEQYYMLLATDGEGMHEARMAARPAHLARLEELQAQGRLLTAGPTPLPEDDGRVSGSLIVASFASLDEAEEWASQDPYALAGVYGEILIRPYRAVFK